MATSNTPAQDTFANLCRYQYALLTTFRKDGRAVPTIVWFAPDQDKLYVMTPSTTGKIKRIRNNGRVVLAPCNARGKVLGEPVEAQAHELSVNEYSRAVAALARKYGFLHRVAIFFQNVRKVKRTFIEIA
ncbi:MAG TPA: PPOX class F420-dependent oxidoreductase [Ktedonobacteraceae bacterium]|nr:PPOX class F420-dependent oxidoreductase [Ktedonobacteraceae bacterium]